MARATGIKKSVLKLSYRVKDAVLNPLQIDSVKLALKNNKAVHLAERQEYSDGTESITVQIHYDPSKMK